MRSADAGMITPLAGRIVVILPTYNRAHTLGRALDSLRAQTDRNWHCFVLDDGSTDQTRDVAIGYAVLDPRITYLHSPENKGGVAMNEWGMTLAYAEGTIWTRLGSDDAFLPDKLTLDRLALGAGYGACYGPYQHYSVFRGPWSGSTEWSDELNIPRDARAMLLRGEFAVSWANIAVRTSVLRQVGDAFGNFVDPRLRNMEDYLFNTRAARFTEFAWRARGAGRHRNTVVIGATDRMQVSNPYQPDALYTVATESASYGGAMLQWRNQDAQLTDVCRGDDHARGIVPLDLAKPLPIWTDYPGAA